MDEGVRRENDIQREYANVSNSCAPAERKVYSSEMSQGF